MNWLDRLAIERLRRAGMFVGRREDAINWLREGGLYIGQPPLDPSHALAANGYRVFPPKHAPAFGSVWVPTRGKSPPRKVECVYPAGPVTYLAGGKFHQTTLRAWHRWRQRTRAKEQT